MERSGPDGKILIYLSSLLYDLAFDSKPITNLEQMHGSEGLCSVLVL